MRTLHTLAVGVVVAFAALAALVTSSVHAQTAAPTVNPFVGLQADDAFDRTPAYRKSALKRIATTGTGTVRRTIDWSLVEPRKGKRNWKAYDAQIAAAARAGLQVLPVLFNAPSWASTKPRKGAKRGTYRPKRVSQFAAFAAAAAKRYGTGGSYWRAHRKVPAKPIVSWQVWNEPNLPVYWQPQPRATQYAALLKATSRAIKAVDPSAQILTGGLPQSKLGIPLTTYIQQLYDAGAAASFDTLAVNPYAPTADGVLGFLRQIRSVMDGAGDTEGQLFATEIGWSDVGPGSTFKLGAKGQAAAIASVIPALWAERESLKLQGVVYFAWRDGPPYAGGKDFWGLHTGLRDLRNRPKPAYSAFKNAVAGLR